MTALRQRMIDALVLHGMAERTQEAYIGAVVQLARHYRCSPEALDGAQVQAYLVHLLSERHLSRSTVNQYGCAYRFLFGTVIGAPAAQYQIPLPRAPQRLPEILSREELARLFAVARSPKSRTLLMLAYGSGLRLSELCHLRVAEIDGHADRRCIHVVQGKGAKDRYVPLADDVLELLRAWWHIARPRQWLFAAAGNPDQPLGVKSAQRWYHAACADAGIAKRGGIHTLRHCYATHLLEAGVDLYTLSQWLGHSHVSTTTRYLHLARPDAPEGARRSPLALLGVLAASTPPPTPPVVH